MNATPFWFGPDDHRLFGWLHTPTGPCRGAVVLCHPIGYEHLLAYSTFVKLATCLATAGFVTLRFDYAGTGDSLGDDYEPARVASWLESIDRAIDLLKERANLPLAALGMRLGGTLVGVAASRRDDIDAVVLWDPCVSGRSFIREAKMLHIVGVGVDDVPADDDSFEAAGQVFTQETADDLQSVDLTALSRPLARRGLMLARRDRPFSAKARANLDATNEHLTWDEAVGQSELVDEQMLLNKIPMEAVDKIVAWLTEQFRDEHPLPDLGNLPEVAVISHAARGRVIERPVRLGELGLFGVITELEGPPDGGPTIVFLNYGTGHHIGPSRLWVDLARKWAPHGVRAVRLDLSGIGDSPVRPGQRPCVANAPQAYDDVVQVASALHPDDPHEIVLIGICSGAYLSIDVAALHGVRGVYAINANLRFEPADLLSGNGQVTRAAPPSRSVIRRASSSKLGEKVRDRIPPLAWHMLDRLHIHPAPTHSVERIVDSGTDTFMGHGTDSDLNMLVRRGKYALRNLERRPNFHLEVVDGMDHLLMLRRHRSRMADALTSHIVSKYGTAS